MAEQRIPDLRPHGGLAQWASSTGHTPPLDVLDLSVSVNPFGPPTRLLEQLQAVDLSQYPDPSCLAARRSLGAWLELSPERIVVGSGAAELLWSVCRTLLREHASALLWEPCFGEVAAAVRACRARVHSERWQPGQSPREALDHLRRAIERVRPTLVSLCAPTSPRGQHVPLNDLRQLCEEFSAAWFLVDQSFLGMSRQREELLSTLPHNALLVRSLTKELGTPGLRVGYAVVPEHLLPQIDAQRPAWSVGAAAQRAAEIYPTVTQEIANVVQQLLQLAGTLAGELALRGYRVVPSDTQYFVCELPDGCDRSVQQLNATLIQHHAVHVRDCSSFGMPRSFRVAAHPDQRRLLQALDAFAKEPTWT